VKQYRDEHADEEPPLTPSERIQLAEAQRELRELRMENEFLNYADVRVMPMFRLPCWSGR
jgi:transposase